MGTDDPLGDAIRAAHHWWASRPPERFPLNFQWEPLGHEVGTDKVVLEQDVLGEVPRVPTVPTKKDKTQHCTRAEALAAWEERAAIFEYDGGFSREEAERQATAELGGSGLD